MIDSEKIFIVCRNTSFRGLCSMNPSNTDKTLIAWVSLTSTDLMEGSVLTIQDGDRFDGIILSEEDGGKWVTGSELVTGGIVKIK